MKILDLDMDYFMKEIITGVGESNNQRPYSDEDYGVWEESEVRDFLENNLGLSKNKKSKGRIVSGHNESLFWWKELIANGELSVPFEVIHIDSHADLGLGYSSWTYILNELLQYSVDERPKHNSYVDCWGNTKKEGIGDYLLFAIAYRWISKLTYCANPNGDKNDYIVDTLKNFEEKYIWNKPVENTIQLVYNSNMELPQYSDSKEIKKNYIDTGIKEPEVPLLIIPTIDDVKYDGDFDFIGLAQSPNYTPVEADYIMELFKEYIIEI